MERPSIKRLRSATCLASALLLLQGIAAAAPAPDPAMDPAAMSVTMRVIPDRMSTGAGAGQDLYLEVMLNGNPTRQIAHFRRDGAHLYAGVDTLLQLGFRRL